LFLLCKSDYYYYY